MKYSSTAYQSSVALYREGPVSEVSEFLPIGRPGRPEAHGEASPTVGPFQTVTLKQYRIRFAIDQRT